MLTSLLSNPSSNPNSGPLNPQTLPGDSGAIHELRRAIAIDIIPLANPDGFQLSLEHRAWRGNTAQSICFIFIYFLFEAMPAMLI